MAGFKHGINAVVLVGPYDYSAYLDQSDVDPSINNPTTTTYGANGVRRQVRGVKDAAVTFGGIQNTMTAASVTEDASRNTVVGFASTPYGAASTTAMSICREGTTIGLPAELMSARHKAYKAGSPVDNVVRFTSEWESDGAGVDFGVSLHAKGSVAASANGASVDNAAATTNGYVTHIHSAPPSGTLVTLDVKVQHSTDDAVWVDLAQFAQIDNAPDAVSERIEGTGTVNRYVRAIHVQAGTDDYFDFCVTFARR